MRKVLIYPAALATLVLPACAIYKIDIPQGNIVDPEEAAKLRPGLTRRQVQFLLGTPAITDPFHQNRWDYVYFFKPGRGQTEKYSLSVVFEGDQVTRIEGTVPTPKLVDQDVEEMEEEKGRDATTEKDMPGEEQEEQGNVYDKPLD
jgi:outer membrane protein assembly factor BamE